MRGTRGGPPPATPGPPPPHRLAARCSSPSVCLSALPVRPSAAMQKNPGARHGSPRQHGTPGRPCGRRAGSAPTAPRPRATFPGSHRALCLRCGAACAAAACSPPTTTAAAQPSSQVEHTRARVRCKTQSPPTPIYARDSARSTPLCIVQQRSGGPGGPCRMTRDRVGSRAHAPRLYARQAGGPRPGPRGGGVYARPGRRLATQATTSKPTTCPAGRSPAPAPLPQGQVLWVHECQLQDPRDWPAGPWAVRARALAAAPSGPTA